MNIQHSTERMELSERNKLLGIFPEELWKKILKNCEDDADTLIACSHASIFWRDLLEPERTLYLFPKVRNLAQLINNRVGVNHLLETPPHRKSLQIWNYEHNRMSDLADSCYLRFILSSNAKIWKRLESEILPCLDSPAFSDGSSPFPSRTIEIFAHRQPATYYENRPEDDPIRPWEENVPRLKAFLEKAGHYFWSAYLSIQGGITQYQCYPHLCSFVSLMLNLKSLFIINGGGFEGLTDISEFPQLRALELLSMANVPETVMRSICSVNSHIKICIVNGSFQAALPRAFDLGCLNDLSTLCASIYHSEHFQMLPPYWNLKILRVDLSMCPSLQLKTIFNKVETYKETLTELQLSLPTYSLRPETDDKLIFWETSKTLLHLPKLRRLEMEVRNKCSLDFLLGLKSLEYLRFQANHNEAMPPVGCNIIQRIDFEKCSDFLKCNIWEKIGCLKKVDIKFNSRSTLQSYSRKDIR